MLFRVCPEQKMCTHELIGSVFDKAGANPMSVVNALVDNLADSATKSAAISSTFQMLVTIASTRSDSETFGIDSATLVAHVKDLHPDLSWPDIIRGWDSATADPLPERQGVLFFASLLLSAPTAIPGLWGTWVNPSRQLGLIERLLSLPPDTFNPCSLAVPGRRVVTSGDVAMASQPIKTIASSLQTQVWNSFDLVDTLIRLSDSAPGPDGSLSPRVRDVLDRAGKTSPDLLLVGLMMIKVRDDGLLDELTTARRSRGTRCTARRARGCSRSSSPVTRRIRSSSTASGSSIARSSSRRCATGTR